MLEKMGRCARLLLASAALASLVGVVNADVVVVVSADNPVGTLSAEQVADIFLGRTNRFPDGRAAVPIDQPEGADQRAEFYALYLGQSPVQIRMHWSKLIFTGRGQPPRQARSADDVKARLARDINAIGYIDRSAVDETVSIVLEPESLSLER